MHCGLSQYMLPTRAQRVTKSLNSIEIFSTSCKTGAVLGALGKHNVASNSTVGCRQMYKLLKLFFSVTWSTVKIIKPRKAQTQIGS